MTPYLYPSRRESVVWFVVAAVVTVITVWRLAPSSWRPRPVVVPAVGCVAAYLALTVGAETGFSQWLDHDVFERFQGGVDDIATWLVAAGGAFAPLAVIAALSRGRTDR